MQECNSTETGKVREMINLVASVVPMLDTIKQSIEESSGQIPRASQQLQNVTQSTETATMEILNVLDSMTQKLNDAETGFASLKYALEARYGIEQQMGQWMRDVEHTPAGARELSALRTLWTQHQQVPTFRAAMGTIEQSLAQTKADSIDIAMALQVQDITSQQIAGVLGSIEQVCARLQKAMVAVGGTEAAVYASAVPLPAKAVPSHYDTDAV
jgi:chemotaxis regulatin CheY-phosphate phosphatase CheZ